MKALIEHGNVVAIEFTDRIIHKEDIIELENLISEVRTNYNHANILILITQLESVTFRACIESVKILFNNRKDIKKIAIVSDKSVYSLDTILDNLFTPWKEQYFDISNIDSAWEWIKK